ncbi:MAG: 4'-phosphopantetheinyl transferase superfamily protein [Clostridia bacterium]|nr:4'-phosphopantetheinyl transferase superfamily protein [Clostridia bacterium]
MLKLYYTLQKTDSHAFLFHVLETYHGVSEQPLFYGEHKKPYFKDDPVFFSISHSGKLTAVAVSDTPVGLDVEDTERTGNYTAVFNRLAPEERAEITSFPDFLTHWTAKESYVKYCGKTLAALYEKLTYTHRTLALNGTPLAVKLQIGALAEGKYVYSLCAEAKERAEISEVVL